MRIGFLELLTDSWIPSKQSQLDKITFKNVQK